MLSKDYELAAYTYVCMYIWYSGLPHGQILVMSNKGDLGGSFRLEDTLG